MPDEIDNMVERQMHERQQPRRATTLMVRNVLNILFMVCAVAGVVCILKGQRSMGTYVVMAAMVIKFAEAAIRMMRK